MCVHTCDRAVKGKSLHGSFRIPAVCSVLVMVMLTVLDLSLLGGGPEAEELLGELQRPVAG